MPLSGLPYRKYYLLALVVFIITAIFSSGYHNHDEHFQILEFCGYKLGLSPAIDLPWEFEAHIRPALQPFIAYSFANMLQGAGLYNPFTIALTFRLLMAIGTWWSTSLLTQRLLPDFKHELGRKLFIACSFFLWFVPYTAVRFSAEGFSGMLFCFASATLLAPTENSGKYYLKLLLAGALLGFAWFARVQLGFALLGVAVWILFVKKMAVKHWLTMLLSFAIAVALCVCIDYWFYNEWVFTPYNYFETNLLHNKAAEFGISPWWGYFELFIMNGVPPLSIVLLVLFFRGVWAKPLHLFTLACLAFFIGHCFVGHKEMRFLYPLVIPFIYVVCTGIDGFLLLPRKKIYTIGVKVLVFINVALLVYRTFTPAQDMVNYYSFMYGQAKGNKKGRTTLLYTGTSPYNIITLNVNFYKHPKLDLQSIDSIQQLKTAPVTLNTYYYSPRILDKETVERFHLERMYSSLPEWILKFNFNNWQERTKIGVLYKVER